MTTLLVLAWTMIVAQALAVFPCVQRIEKHGMVCVCNATYCDAIDPVGNLGKGSFALYQSSKAGDRMRKTTQQFAKKDNDGWQNIRLDFKTEFQTMKGFGAAFTDAAALNFFKTSPQVQKQLLEQYWGCSGAQYTIGRVPIASCDFSTHVYSYDDVKDDFNLTHFDVSEDDAQKIPLIQRALALSSRNVSLFASPWAPPAWMTNENRTTGNPTLKGGATSPYAHAWALYFSRFFDAYAERGIKFWAVTAQNEPAGNTGKWQDLKFSASTQRDFIKSALGPQLRSSHPDIKIMILDDQRIHLPGWADTILSDPDAAIFVDGIGIHWYAALEDKTPEFLYFGKVAETHKRHPDRFILATEACEGYLPWSQGPRLGDWMRAETYAHDILGDLNAFAAGWTDWNAFLDRSGGPNWAKNVVDAPIIINEETGTEFYKQPMYYALAHFSKFITPGSRRILAKSESRPFSAPMETTAFVTPEGETVVVVLNRDILDHKYFIEVPGRGFINIDNIPAHSFQTIVFES